MDKPTVEHPYIDDNDREGQTYASWRYIEELPEQTEDNPLSRGVKLLETYSKIPRDEIPSHVKALVSVSSSP